MKDKYLIINVLGDLPPGSNTNLNNTSNNFKIKFIYNHTKRKKTDENQIKEAFINGGRGHPPSHLKFFLLVFSKLKEDIK